MHGTFLRLAPCHRLRQTLDHVRRGLHKYGYVPGDVGPERSSPTGNERMPMSKPVLLFALAITPLLAASTTSAATPAQTCQSNKNKAAGKYAYCRQKAEGRFALTGNAATRTTSLQR